MAAALQQKNYELKTNELLFDNLKLLSTIYPGRKELEEVLKKDMFLKTNKIAFNEVVYYLYNLEYMVKTEKLRNWPPFDAKAELGFRQEIIKHVTKLNEFYKHSDIPILMPSQLGSPGGQKIAKFLLKWSELCLFEHCIKTKPYVLHCIKPNKNSEKIEIIFKALQNQIVAINHQVYTMFNKYDEMLNYKKTLSETIEIKQKKYSDNIVIVEKQLRKEKIYFEKTFPVYPSDEYLNEQIHKLAELCDILAPISNKFDEIEEFRNQLVTENRLLIHDKDEFKVPEEIQHVVQNRDILDLKYYFDGLKSFLEPRLSDLPSLSLEYLEKNNSKVEEFAKRYADLNDKLQDKLSILQSEMEEISYLEEPLAVPLPDELF